MIFPQVTPMISPTSVVMDTVFTVNSSHEGTVIKLKDKAGIVSMEYGVEAYCPAKHMKKATRPYALMC